MKDHLDKAAAVKLLNAICALATAIDESPRQIADELTAIVDKRRRFEILKRLHQVER